LGICGCTHFLEKRKGEERVASAGALFAQGKYRASLKETEDGLRLYPRSLGDKALFLKGLIYASPKNPEQNYQRALKCFQRVMNEFPRSKARRQAEVWVLVIQEVIEMERERGELRQENSQTGKVLRIEKERVKESEDQRKRLQAEVEKLKEQLLRLKEIDLGIEEKKSQTK